MRLSSFVKRFTKDKRGATVLIFALSLPVLIGFLGLGSEVGYWYVNQRNMQTAADFGAYTAAVELRGNKADSWAVTQGTKEAVDNGANSSTEVTVNIPPSSGSISTNDAAEVIVVRSLPRLFSALFVDEPLIITVRAVAQFSEGGPACILALSRDAEYAIDIIGTADVTLTGCDVQSNSTSPNAARVQGSADMTTGCFSAAGGVSASAGLTLTDCDEPKEGAALSNDPYADLPMPPFTPGDCVDHANSTPSSTITISPGHFCVLDFRGAVTMEPGLYIVEGGGFSAGAQADLTGTGVTIVLTGGGVVNMAGGAEVKLSAPTEDNSTADSEPYEGILFYQDRDATDDINRVNGNSNSTFEGIFYFPSQAVNFNGNNSSGPGCMMLVANTVRISGSSEFGNACTVGDAFFTQVTSPGYVRLME